jgi:hypothetical protein
VQLRLAGGALHLVPLEQPGGRCTPAAAGVVSGAPRRLQCTGLAAPALLAV